MQNPQPFGKYILHERVAVGGMAEIFRAKMHGVDGFEKNLVVKQILPQYAKNREFIQMFIDEAKITVSLNHGNIVPVFELGQIDGIYFIAMDWIDGKNLGEVLDQTIELNVPLSIPHGLYLASEMLAGLDYAHRKTDDAGRSVGIVHRDVSPQNILISYEGEVKVVDFGIARAATKVHETRAGVIKGKFGYMSPEQACGEAVDARSDIFAVGILLYEMLTLERLFFAENDAVVIDRVKRADVPTPSSVNPALPPQLDAILFKALARDPAARYQTAGEMRTDLSRLLFSLRDVPSSQTLSLYMKMVFAEEIQERIALRASEPPAPVIQPQMAQPPASVQAPVAPDSLLAEAQQAADQNLMLLEDGELDDDFSYMRAGRRIRWMITLVILTVLIGGGLIYRQEIARVFSTIGNVVDESAERLAQKELGTLYVRSRPSGAAVYFGNQKQGTTNMRIRSIDPAKDYELVMTMEGYTPYSRMVLPADWKASGKKMEIQIFQDWTADSFK